MISEEPTDEQEDKGHWFHSYWQAIEAQAQIRMQLDLPDSDYQNLQQKIVPVDGMGLDDEQYQTYLSGAFETTGSAVPYFIAPEICPPVFQLADEVPDDYAFSATDFPTETGYLLFATPFQKDGLRMVSPYSAISWRVYYGKFAFVTWWMCGENAGWMLGGLAKVEFKERLSDFVIRIVALKRDKPEAMEFKIKMLAGVLIFMNSKLTTTTEFSLPRQVRRRMETVVRPETSVRVVSLRKTEQQNRYEGDAGSIEFTHRFIVNGHWRQQCMATAEHEGGRCWHRPTWIAPFIKGPDNKPLAMPQTIYNVMR